jgi:transcriptional regulator with XRE-family HTH domain
MPTNEQRWVIRSAADFGRAIAGLRAEQGVTQSELAARSGVSRHYVAQLERGATALMLERVLRLLRRLGAEVTVTRTERSGDA